MEGAKSEGQSVNTTTINNNNNNNVDSVTITTNVEKMKNEKMVETGSENSLHIKAPVEPEVIIREPPNEPISAPVAAVSSSVAIDDNDNDENGGNIINGNDIGEDDHSEDDEPTGIDDDEDEDDDEDDVDGNNVMLLTKNIMVAVAAAITAPSTNVVTDATPPTPPITTTTNADTIVVATTTTTTTTTTNSETSSNITTIESNDDNIDGSNLKICANVTSNDPITATTTAVTTTAIVSLDTDTTITTTTPPTTTTNTETTTTGNITDTASINISSIVTPVDVTNTTTATTTTNTDIATTNTITTGTDDIVIITDTITTPDVINIKAISNNVVSVANTQTDNIKSNDIATKTTSTINVDNNTTMTNSKESTHNFDNNCNGVTRNDNIDITDNNIKQNDENESIMDFTFTETPIDNRNSLKKTNNSRRHTVGSEQLETRPSVINLNPTENLQARSTLNLITNPADIIRQDNRKLTQAMATTGLVFNDGFTMMKPAPETNIPSSPESSSRSPSPLIPLAVVDVVMSEPSPPPSSSTPIQQATMLQTNPNNGNTINTNVNNISNNIMSLDSRKRKAPTISINLMQFVHLLYEIYDEMIFDNATKQMSFKRPISTYVDNCSSAKYLKFDENSTSVGIPPNSSDNFKSKVYNCIMNKLFVWFENQNATFIFPKELLRYFLATHIKFIKPSDFIETNAIPKADKRGKTVAQLLNGSILYEYAKGFDIFVSSMARSDIGDIQALKFIIQKKITIPSNMYEQSLNIKFTPKPHIQDIECTHREDYSQIMITNNKQMFVLITKNIVMIYDGTIFVAPTTNTEREFTTKLREESKLNEGDYMLLDIMFAVKIRVIDVLQCSLNGKTTLPESYTSRLQLIQRILPGIRLATITTQQRTNNNDCSYIHKPNVGFGPSYIYHKSNLTTAAIGILDKNVILALHDRNDKSLVVKYKVSISGSASYLLAIMPTIAVSIPNNNSEPQEEQLQSQQTSQPQGPSLTILMDDIPIRIVGDLKDVRLFEKIIPIELKDCNRLGLYSNRPISDVSEYKTNTVRKESAILDDITKQINLNPDLLSQILMKAAVASVTLNDEAKAIIRNILDPKFDISFNGYNNMS